MSGKPNARFITKAVKDAPTPPQYGPHWSLAKRGAVQFFDDRVELGKWSIPFDKMTSVTVWRAKTQLGFPCPILEVQTEDVSYQFGLNPWAKPQKYLNVEFKERSIKMQYTAYSVVFRIVLIALLLFFIFG